jgi:hypothetical protein
LLTSVMTTFLSSALPEPDARGPPSGLSKHRHGPRIAPLATRRKQPPGLRWDAKTIFSVWHWRSRQPSGQPRRSAAMRALAEPGPITRRERDPVPRRLPGAACAFVRATHARPGPVIERRRSISEPDHAQQGNVREVGRRTGAAVCAQLSPGPRNTITAGGRPSVFMAGRVSPVALIMRGSTSPSARSPSQKP